MPGTVRALRQGEGDQRGDQGADQIAAPATQDGQNGSRLVRTGSAWTHQTSAARELYERFLTRARSEYKDKVGKIEDGEFGAMMDVHIVNDGPVTIVLDSKNRN